jgi:2,3-bisphosphoglycerate-dependent phosphoglycerate mutase
LSTLILLRHGQSQWNLEDRFTGWVDVDLTAEGEAQARRGGELIKAQGLAVDQVFTSVLTRAIRTSWLALAAADQCYVPEVKDWRLNERHYGGLTGLNKTETAKLHGADQVKVWRRSYDVPPPDLAADSPYDFSKDRRYAGLTLPATESLKTTLDRVKPCWDAEIAPHLDGRGTILVAAHGNSLRAIVKLLFGLSAEQIIDVEIPTGNPLVVELGQGHKPKAARYLDAGRATALPPL